MPTVPAADPDVDLLLQLRAVVARYGEQDLAGWWSTKGQLGRHGAIAVRRGFPRTHFFAQARTVFAVAAHRCEERIPPGGVSLWNLPAAIEEAFEIRWEHWIDHASDWADFFGRIAKMELGDLATTLETFGLTSAAALAAYKKLKPASEGRAAELSTPFAGMNDDLRLLALGFARGTRNDLVVPYARGNTR